MMPSNLPVSYASYLRVPELLELQRPLSAPAQHDEMLFIVVHQVHELWFRQMLHELTAVRDAMLVGEPLRALKGLRRVHAIQRVLGTQIDVLETMTPQDFNAFRDLLRPASGFQSMQFRELEFLSGGGRPATLQLATGDEAGLARVQARRAEPSLVDAFFALLRQQGWVFPEPLRTVPAGAGDQGVRDEVVEALVRLYQSPEDSPERYALYLLAEALVDYDELVLLWRGRHVRMVERTIGHKPGTGGSDGAAYLHKTLEHRFFPELWAVRSRLGGASAVAAP